MKAAVYDAFEGLVEVRKVDDPVPGDSGAVLRVEAALSDPAALQVAGVTVIDRF